MAKTKKEKVKKDPSENSNQATAYVVGTHGLMRIGDPPMCITLAKLPIAIQISYLGSIQILLDKKGAYTSRWLSRIAHSASKDSKTVHEELATFKGKTVVSMSGTGKPYIPLTMKAKNAAELEIFFGTDRLFWIYINKDVMVSYDEIEGKEGEEEEGEEDDSD